MHERNSRFPIPLSFAKLDTFRSSAAAPASIVFWSTNFISEKGDPSLTTTPFIPLSLISKLEPAPSIVNFSLFC